MAQGWSAEIVGLRDQQGRFASMRDGRLRAIQQEEAVETGDRLLRLYQSMAPKGETGNFSRGFELVVDATEVGFSIEIETDNPELADWLKHGTGIYGPRGQEIVPKTAQFLHFEYQGEEYFLRSVKGMKPNDWEDRAQQLAEPLMRELGNRIGHRVVLDLARP